MSDDEQAAVYLRLVSEALGLQYTGTAENHRAIVDRAQRFGQLARKTRAEAPFVTASAVAELRSLADPVNPSPPEPDSRGRSELPL